jgi:hypothetical protein
VADDIVAFLNRCIDEDERVATAAGGTWTHECQHVDDNNQYYDDTNPHPDCSRVGGSILIYDEGGHDATDAEHMIRFDPARVLAEVQAKRAILAELEKHARDTAGHYETDDEVTWRLGLEFAVRALAQPYAGQPGFDPSWLLET